MGKDVEIRLVARQRGLEWPILGVDHQCLCSIGSVFVLRFRPRLNSLGLVAIIQYSVFQRSSMGPMVDQQAIPIRMLKTICPNSW